MLCNFALTISLLNANNQNLIRVQSLEFGKELRVWQQLQPTCQHKKGVNSRIFPQQEAQKLKIWYHTFKKKKVVQSAVGLALFPDFASVPSL